MAFAFNWGLWCWLMWHPLWLSSVHPEFYIEELAVVLSLAKNQSVAAVVGCCCWFLAGVELNLVGVVVDSMTCMDSCCCFRSHGIKK